MPITWTEGQKTGQTEFVGSVLGTREIPDSLFERDYVAAVVWTGEKVEEIRYACYHWGGSSGCSAAVEVDATEEVKTLAAKYAERIRLMSYYAADDREAQQIFPNKRIRVIKGRKIPVGVEGIVFWIGPDRFKGGNRCGFKDDGGTTHWISTGNIEVVNWQTYCRFSEAERTKKLEELSTGL